MNIVIFIILVAGLVLRTLLDLATLNGSSLVIDVLYTLIYGVAGVSMVVDNPKSVFGYLAMMVATIWMMHSFLRYGKLRTKS